MGKEAAKGVVLRVAQEAVEIVAREAAEEAARERLWDGSGRGCVALRKVTEGTVSGWVAREVIREAARG